MAEKTWTAGFWQCHKEPVPCLLVIIWCCAGVGVVQLRDQQKMETHGKTMTCLAPVIGCCFGMAWNRSKLRVIAGLPEDYWTDCLLYAACCCTCMAVQEYSEVEANLTAQEHREN